MASTRKEKLKEASQREVEQHLERAMREGCEVRAWCSGGGIRVVRIEDVDDNLLGYGEHPNVDGALAHAAINFGDKKTYEQQYGNKGIYPCYMTGSSEASSTLDQWILRGSKFVCVFDATRQQFAFILKGYGEDKCPEEVMGKVLREQTAVRYTTARGITFEATPMVFASGRPGVSRVVVANPSGCDPTIWHITKTGWGASFAEAQRAAFEAPEVEVASD